MNRIEYQEIEYSHYPSPEELNEEGKEGWDCAFHLVRFIYIDL